MRQIPYADLAPADREGIRLWGQIDSEHLSHTDLDEAIESFLDDREGFIITTEHEPTVIFGGYVPMALPDPRLDAEWLIESLAERWDEDYGDPEEWHRPGDFSQAVTDAAIAFIEAVRKEFHVWACEDVIRVEVNVMEWVRAHRPDWLIDAEGHPG